MNEGSFYHKASHSMNKDTPTLSYKYQNILSEPRFSSLIGVSGMTRLVNLNNTRFELILDIIFRSQPVCNNLQSNLTKCTII